MNITSKNLNLLKVLLVVAEEENLSRASRRLRLSQPALSHALRRLREEFSDPLFVRGARGLVATAKTRTLLPRLRQVIASVEELYASDEIDFRSASRRFVLGATTYFELRVAGRLLQVLAEEAPAVILETVSLSGDFPKQELERGQMDVAIAAYFEKMPESFRMRVLGRDPFVCVLRRGHPLLKSGLSSSSYLAASHVRIAVPPGRPSLVDVELEKTRKPRRIVAHLGNFLSPPAVLAESDLVLTCPESLARSYTGMFPLVIAKFPFEVPPIEIKMVWHERAHTDSFQKWMRDAIAKSLLFPRT